MINACLALASLYGLDPLALREADQALTRIAHGLLTSYEKAQAEAAGS